MDDKEFRKLRREDLVEIIYQYQRREQRLLQENQKLREQLEDRRIRMEKTGSIAEAALALSGIFESAQKAVDLYTQSVQAGYAPEKDPAEPMAAPRQERPAVPQAAAAAGAAVPYEPVRPASYEQPGRTEEMPRKAAAAAPAPGKESSDRRQTVKQKEKRAAGPNLLKKPDLSRLAVLKKLQKQEPAEKRAQDRKPVQSGTAVKPAEPGKPEEKPEQETVQPVRQQPAVKIPAKPAAAAKPAVGKPGGKKPVSKPESGDTDDFIASLKDYLGM